MATAQVIEQFRTHESDTGSPEVQEALLSSRIDQLTQHFDTHAKDHHSRRGLLKLVSQRRRLLDYLERIDADRYQTLVTKLGLRPLEGQGVGGKLAKAGLEYAREQAHKIIPACEFMEVYIRRHPEYKDLVAE